MFEGLSRSWELVKASWRVLQSDKELIVFPIISGIGALIVSILFAVPFFAVGIAEAGRGSDDLPVTIIGYIILFLFYVVLYSVIFFCNTALVGAALIRLRGGDPTLRDGFNIASQKMGHILGYAVIAATVGVVLRALSERSGLLGKIVISLIGAAWNIATFLVVPVLVNEDVGPIDAVRRSVSLLKQTWGEQLGGNFGMGAVFGLIMLALIIVFVGIITLVIATESAALAFIAFGLLAVAFIGLSLISSTLQGIFQAAVYRYATEGDAGSMFDPQMVAGAFKPKRG
jgi:hypothetical protein